MTDPIETLAQIQDATFARASAATLHAFPRERRLDGTALVTFLARRRFATLATVRPDGRPHAAPTGYALVGHRIVIASLEEAARIRNLRSQPYASLVVTDDVGANGVVMLEGTTRLLTPTAAPIDIRTPFRDEDGSLPSWIGLFIVLAPERILSYAAEGFTP